MFSGSSFDPQLQILIVLVILISVWLSILTMHEWRVIFTSQWPCFYLGCKDHSVIFWNYYWFEIPFVWLEENNPRKEFSFSIHFPKHWIFIAPQIGPKDLSRKGHPNTSLLIKIFTYRLTIFHINFYKIKRNEKDMQSIGKRRCIFILVLLQNLCWCVLRNVVSVYPDACFLLLSLAKVHADRGHSLKKIQWHVWKEITHKFFLCIQYHFYIAKL